MDQQTPQPTKSRHSGWAVVIIILVLCLAGGFFYWRSFQPETEDTDNPYLENAMTQAEERFTNNANSTGTNTSVTSNGQQNTDSTATTGSLVGTWTSDCLVPDANSPWSEQHKFVFLSDGSAVHTRWSGSDHNCTVVDTLVNTYSYVIPGTGQINLTDQDTGSTIYDIYLISGDTLEFGHGFQSPYPAGYDATQGYSAANRFHDLNTYIIYKK
ncbi:MAG: hypothetical protein WC544_00755 [Patescibacteria group bacterium]